MMYFIFLILYICNIWSVMITLKLSYFKFVFIRNYSYNKFWCFIYYWTIELIVLFNEIILVVRSIDLKLAFVCKLNVMSVAISQFLLYIYIYIWLGDVLMSYSRKKKHPYNVIVTEWRGDENYCFSPTRLLMCV